MRQVPPLDDKAEGTCGGFPYNTELASINGVAVHFWVGDYPVQAPALQAAERKIRGARDVVSVTWSYGHPSGFWAHADIA